MKSSELLNLSSLGDFRLGEGYYVELKHGCMGNFLAIISENEESFMCISKKTIESAIHLLPKRAFKINKLLFLINEKKRIAFSLGALYSQLDINQESESFPILTDEDLKDMKVGDLKWTPGLVGNDMSLEEFEETLDLALSQI